MKCESAFLEIAKSSAKKDNSKPIFFDERSSRGTEEFHCGASPIAPECGRIFYGVAATLRNLSNDRTRLQTRKTIFFAAWKSFQSRKSGKVSRRSLASSLSLFHATVKTKSRVSIFTTSMKKNSLSLRRDEVKRLTLNIIALFHRFSLHKRRVRERGRKARSCQKHLWGSL